jgi:hypothetical protein
MTAKAAAKLGVFLTKLAEEKPGITIIEARQHALDAGHLVAESSLYKLIDSLELPFVRVRGVGTRVVTERSEARIRALEGQVYALARYLCKERASRGYEPHPDVRGIVSAFDHRPNDGEQD